MSIIVIILKCVFAQPLSFRYQKYQINAIYNRTAKPTYSLLIVVYIFFNFKKTFIFVRVKFFEKLFDGLIQEQFIAIFLTIVQGDFGEYQLHYQQNRKPFSALQRKKKVKIQISFQSFVQHSRYRPSYYNFQMRGGPYGEGPV